MRLPAAQRRDQLLDAAIPLFATDGYHGTSMNDIADTAGVTKPVLYQHFSSKHDLFLTLLTDIGERLRLAVEKAVTEASGPRDQIDRGIEAYFGYVATHRQEFEILFGLGTHRDEEFAAVTQRVETSMAEAVAALIDVESLTEQERLVLANGIVGLAEGACRYWLRTDPDSDPVTQAARVSRLAWAGLRGVG